MTRGFAIASVNSMFELLASRPPVLAGVTLNTGMLGGVFSPDGIHPSNTVHALLANLFLDSLNTHYGTSSLVPFVTLNIIAARDPFVDLNKNGKVRGRPLAGLFETLAPFLGLSGDDETARRRTGRHGQRRRASVSERIPPDTTCRHGESADGSNQRVASLLGVEPSCALR